MPEALEFFADGAHIDHYIGSTKPEDRVIEHIFGDPTGKEVKEHLPGSRGAAGHVYELDSSSTVRRGGSVKEEKKTPIFPEKYATSPGSPLIPISTHKLCLVKVTTAPRALVLEFKEGGGVGTSYWCQVQLFTHTNVQIFTLDEWNNAVCKVDRKTRGYKIGLALVFKAHVLAFLTLDLLIQVYWSDNQEGLPPSPADVVTEYSRFLEELVEWIRKRRTTNSERKSIAMNVIRDETRVFSGAGVYTIQEVFHRAGLSPNITEFELFDNPSRTARLVAAYYHYCVNARERAWPFLKPFIHGFLRACRREDRALYSHELLVHGKDRTNHSARFKGLLKQFNSSLELHSTSDEKWARVHGSHGVPFDVFEPDLVRSALQRKELGLGSLIFGESHWQKLAPGESFITGSKTALSRYFDGPEFDHSKTWLDLTYYDCLFNPPPSRQGMTAWSRTKLYRWSKTFVWSVIPVYPPLSTPDPAGACPKLEDPKGNTKSSSSRKSKCTAKKKTKGDTASKTPGRQSRVKIETMDEETRSVRLLKTATQHSEIFTVGPLDFCGVAQIVTGPGGTDVVMVCKMDPRRSTYCIERHILGAATAKLKGKGLEKKGIDAKTKKSLLKKVSKRKRDDDDDGGRGDKENEVSTSESFPLSLQLPTPPPSSPPPMPFKRRRRSADRDILAQMVYN